MRQARDEAFLVPSAVRHALDGVARPVLAISGGLDSMVLLSVVSELPVRAEAIVATFDHGTGPAATQAVDLVARKTAESAMQCVTGMASGPGISEEEWRRARWQFLREVAERVDGTIVTGHTADDQVETIFMRILREAGPRGLAGLYADSDVLRPFLELSRETLRNYAESRDIAYVEDPTNVSRRYLRNRVRHDLLPSICRIRPRFCTELLEISRRSAEWRRAMESLLETVDALEGPDGSLRVARSSLAGYDADSLRVLWPALAAKAHVVMDRRGTHRAAEFTMKGATGRSIQLSGRFEIVMHRDHMLLRRWGPGPQVTA